MRKNSLKYEEATNGLEALKAYQAEVRKFDVILMGKELCFTDFNLNTYKKNKSLNSEQTCRCQSWMV